MDDAKCEEGIRLARRRRFDRQVTLRDPHGNGEVRLACRDVSVSGMFVLSHACAAPGAEFECTLEVDGATLEAVGRVRRIQLDAARAGMGIEFTRLCRETRERLTAFIAETVAGDGAALAV